ncbi:MAG: hypothetical protein RJA59_1638 [Pseudomonadota bacterium]
MTKAEAKLVKAGDPRAVRIAERVLASARRVAVKRAPSVAAKATKRANRRETITAIRAQVMADCGGVCEVPGCKSQATDLHHTISGPERRIKESALTCLGVCDAHHRLAHRGDLDTLDAMQRYCSSCGAHDAAAAIAKRIDKIMEARASARSPQPGAGGK